MTTWTQIGKASGTSWTKISKPSDGRGTLDGQPIGLLLALTYGTSGVGQNTWTKVNKTSGTSWTIINKAT